MEFKPIVAWVSRKPQKVLAQISRDMVAQPSAIAVEKESTDATLLSWTETTLFRAALCSAVAKILAGLVFRAAQCSAAKILAGLVIL